MSGIIGGIGSKSGIIFNDTATLGSNVTTTSTGGQSIVYETGTFRPTIGRDSGAITTSYSTNAGRYVRIGAFVLIWFDITLSSHSGGSGSYTIRDLPFSAYSGGTKGGYGAFSFRSGNLMPSDFRVYGSSSYLNADNTLRIGTYDSNGNEEFSYSISNSRLTGQASYFCIDTPVAHS